MKQSLFEAQYSPFWQKFDACIRLLETKPKNVSMQERLEFTENYRLLCQHLALSQSRAYSLDLTEYLQQLSERSYALLYQNKPHLIQQLLDFVFQHFPQVLSDNKRWIYAGHALFYIPFLVFFIAVWINPAWLALLGDEEAGPNAVSSFQSMMSDYQTGNNRDLSTNFYMFAFYVFNNIGIAFKTFISGLILGIGTLYISVSNGLSIGGVMAYISHNPVAPTFFSFVIGHGAFELTAITLAASGGLKLGYALFFPKGLSRKDAMKKHGKVAAQMMGAAFIMMFIAAIIEGFWSPVTSIPMWIKYVVGTCLWIGVYVYLFSAIKRENTT